MVGSAAKVDLRRELGDLYRATAEPVLVEVPSMPFLMVDGHGDPNDSVVFSEAVDGLYAVAYGLKFRARALQDGFDFAVMPLEGLWWIPNAKVWDFDDKSGWDWTLMIAQPELVTASLVDETVAAVREKKQLPGLDRLRFERFEEGTSAQILHTGAFAAERTTLERLFAFIGASGCFPVGKHHEIYLSDPARTAPERMRTIIRHPVARKV
jgi:hypothetical protein